MAFFVRKSSYLWTSLILVINILSQETGTQASSKDCINQTPDLGMAKGTIADADITASTILNSDSHPEFARLGNSKGWIADDKDKHPWMQVNLQAAMNITAIATQGVVYRDKQYFIISYYLSYGDDGNNWVNYTIQGMTKVFQANVDANSIVKVVLNSSVLGKFIRIHPTNCSMRCALRMELYGCNSTGGIPGRPSPPIATSIVATSINITWSAPDYVGDGITGYNVRWEDVGASKISQKVIAGNKSRVATLSNISPYTHYTIQVQAFNGKGDSPWSFPLTVQSGESVPSVAPGNFKLNSSSSLTLDILWDAIPQKKQNGKLLGYTILYKKEGFDTENTKNVGPDILMLKITELKFASYSVRVAGFTGVGVGKFTVALKRFPREGAPSPPRNLQLHVVSSTSIEASWDEPETKNGNIRRYVVYYGKKGIYSHFYTTKTIYRLTSLDENTLYSVQVTAETSVSGSPSSTKYATTLEDVPSSDPVIVKGQDGTKAVHAHTIRVVWEEIPQKDQNGIITGYTVFYKETGQSEYFSKNATARQTSDSIGGLKPFTKYCIKVAGYTKVGRSPLTDPCYEVETLQKGKHFRKDCHEYTIHNFNSLTRQQHPDWRQSQDNCSKNGGYLVCIEYKEEMDFLVRELEELKLAGESEYFIGLQKQSSGWTWICNTNISVTPGKPPWYPGQPAGNGYCAKMYFHTKKGPGYDDIPCEHYALQTKSYICERRISSCHETDIPGRPSPPIATSILATSINITWSAPDYVGDGITGYNVRWEDVGASKISQKVIAGNKSRGATLSNISPYTHYTIQVQAFNGKGDSPWSFPLTVQSGESVPSVAPGNFKVNSSSSLTLDILWDAIPQKKQHGKLLGYKILYRKEGSDTEKTVNVGPDILMLKITELKFASYSVRVAGFTRVGDGKFTVALKRFPREGVPGSDPVIMKGQDGTKAEDAHTIRVVWEEIPQNDQNGIIIGYTVFYNEAGQSEYFSKNATASQTIASIGGLKPFTKYCIKVAGYTKVGRSPLMDPCYEVETLQKGPSHPRDLMLWVESSTSILVSWKEPAVQNGIITNYVIYYGEQEHDQETKAQVTGSTFQRLLTDLRKFTTYYIKVRGKTTELGNASRLLNATTFEDRKYFLKNCHEYTIHNFKNLTRQQHLDWRQSQDDCSKNGGHLVCIEHEEELDFLVHRLEGLKLARDSEYFIGLQKQSSGWTWICNANISVTPERFPWHPSQPSGNGNCAKLYFDKKRGPVYDDIPCEHYALEIYICERRISSCHEIVRSKYP